MIAETYVGYGDEDEVDVPERVRIIGALELIDLFNTECPVSLRPGAGRIYPLISWIRLN